MIKLTDILHHLITTFLLKSDEIEKPKEKQPTKLRLSHSVDFSGRQIKIPKN